MLLHITSIQMNQKRAHLNLFPLKTEKRKRTVKRITKKRRTLVIGQMNQVLNETMMRDVYHHSVETLIQPNWWMTYSIHWQVELINLQVYIQAILHICIQPWKGKPHISQLILYNIWLTMLWRKIGGIIFKFFVFQNSELTELVDCSNILDPSNHFFLFFFFFCIHNATFLYVLNNEHSKTFLPEFFFSF